MNLEKRLNKALKLLSKSGKILRAAFYGKEIDASFKEMNELVTNYDLEIDAFLKAKLLGNFSDSWISEESDSVDGKSDFTWILDPIDGTNNFFSRIPFFCISLGLLNKGEKVAGIVYDPVHDTFYLSKNNESFSIRKKMKVPIKTPTLRLPDSILSYGVSSSGVPLWNDFRTKWWALEKKFRTTRRYGSAALEITLVGLGKLGAYLILGYRIWDVVAAVHFSSSAGAAYYENKDKNILFVYNKGLLKDRCFVEFLDFLKTL